MDLLSIATQSDPIPLKDVPENLLDQYDGVYLGESPFVKTLQDDKFHFNVNGVQQRIEASRWMMLDVDQSLRPRHNDKLMQYYKNMVMQSLRSHQIKLTLHPLILKSGQF